MKSKAIATIMTTLFLASILSMAFVVQVEATPSSIVGLWRFDEGIGSTAADSSGNGNTGTLSGGKFGNALWFDGVDDYVEVPDSSSLEPSVITVEAWVQATTSWKYAYILTKFLPPTANDRASYAFYTGSTGGLRFYVGTTSTYYASPDAGISVWDGKWHHIAGIFDGSEVRLYVDGNKIDGSTLDPNPIWYQGTGNLYIGTYNPAITVSGLNLYFQGKIDEVRISHIVQYPTNFAPPTAPFSPDGNTVALWHFDESVGTTAGDSSSAIPSNNGAIHGASWAGPVWTTDRKVGPYALKFDGINDYVRVPTSSSLQGVTMAVTVEAWLKFDDVRNAMYIRTPYDTQRSWGLDRLGGNLRFYIYDGGTDTSYKICEKAWTPTIDIWYYIAGTYDGTTLKLYVNGALFQSLSYSGDIDPTQQGVVMGARYSYGGSDFHKGSMDEVRIYNSALEPTVIAAHYALNYEPPVADAGGPYTGYEGSSITFTASGSSDPEGKPLQYRWDFNNDGTWDTAWSSSPYASNTWGDDWTCDAKVEVSDGELTAVDTASVTVNNVPPTVEAGADQTVYSGATVTFSGSFTDPGSLDTHTIDWDFGDGGTATDTLTPSHVYLPEGTYTVTLTVTDDDGGVGSDTLTVMRILVSIDIKPRSFPNSIGLNDQGLLPVAILGSGSFNVATIDPGTIQLGGVTLASRGSAKAPKLAYSYEDVNGDGYMDLMVFFEVQQLSLTSDTIALTLTATLYSEIQIEGTDTVQIVPP